MIIDDTHYIRYRFTIQLSEGRNRQIRKMAGKINNRVVSLHRTSFAGITLSGLSEAGDWAYLTPHEIELLYKTM